MKTETPTIGDTVICAETGKTFRVERNGRSFNYARDRNGDVLSDEGVDIRQRRDLLDRSRPFTAYVSGDGRRLTGWKGNVLGHVVASADVRLTRHSYIHGSTMRSYWVRDVHGGYWYGRGSPEIAITVRPIKSLP